MDVEVRGSRGGFGMIDDLGRSTICKLAHGRSANLPVAKLPTLVIISHSQIKNQKSKISTVISYVNIKVVDSRGSAIMII
jgi:hypothetical protein